MKKQYVMIDILKFVSAIIIVAIHTQPFKGHTTSVFFLPYTFLKCFAIPYFFVSSSFLFFKKIDLNDFLKSENLRYLASWMMRLLKIYFFYTFLNLLVEIITGNLYRERNYFEFIFMGIENGYLWFLAALIVSVFVVYFLIWCLNHIVRAKYALGITVIILMIFTGISMIVLQFYNKYFLTTTLQGFIESYYRNFDNVRNVISGIFYVCVGVCVVICEKYYQSKINKILCVILGGVAYIELVVVMNNSIWFEEYSTSLMVVVIFMVMLECTQYNKEVVFAKYLRKASNVFYLQQRYIIIVIAVIKKYIHNNLLDSNLNVFWGVVFVLSLLTVVYCKLEKTNFQKILKYMY